MMLSDIDNYYSSNLHKPFFVAVGDSNYDEYKVLLEKTGVDFVCLSSCCNDDDKKPDLDKFRGLLRTADVDCDSNRVVVLGLGEYLALEGNVFAHEFLSEMANFNLGIAHVVFLLRGVSSVVKALINSDPRYENRQMIVVNDLESLISFNFSTLDLKMYDRNGFKNVLISIESGADSPICVNTNMSFPYSLLQIQRIKDSFEAVNKKAPHIGLCREYGNEGQWDSLLTEVNQLKSIEKVFEKYQFTDSIANDFYSLYEKQGFVGWLSFVYLKLNVKKLTNVYLQYVIESSDSYDNYKGNVLNAIIYISHSCSNFKDLYLSRKRLVAAFPESDISIFVSNNRLNVEECIYKLTDNTNVEREEIIAYIAQYGMQNILPDIYPALASYMKKYHFNGDALNDLLTNYFDEYKRQKIANSVSAEYLALVDSLAVERDYNRLRTRDELVSAIDTNSAFLCWIDALGVEYLSYIIDIANKRGLAVSISVGRSELPTITSINRKFFDSWPKDSKRKVEELDDIKHNEKGGYKYGPNNFYSIHLAKELAVIQDAINEAATELGLRKYDRYIIASDHGASRLAVLRNKEEKYETDTSGEHSGRCCKSFSNYDLPFATEENGYIVLADYGRFKGSRAANVEVHGGASLEEVIVPVITLSLRDSTIIFKVVEQLVKADYKSGIEFCLYVNKQVSAIVSIEYKGKRYSAIKQDENHYKFSINDINKAGVYLLEAYLGDALMSQLKITVTSKSGSTNDAFDDLF